MTIVIKVAFSGDVKNSYWSEQPALNKGHSMDRIGRAKLFGAERVNFVRIFDLEILLGLTHY